MNDFFIIDVLFRLCLFNKNWVNNVNDYNWRERKGWIIIIKLFNRVIN